jgi:uncharacterized membrane protein YcaP (DUF421 family)
MKKEEIHLGDIKRILFGQAPPEFMIEVFIRTVIIFIILLFIVRLMGKRMSGQITITELAVMVTLGAIVSPVMQLPDRGILFGVVVLTAALLFQRYINLWGFKNEKIEKATQGHMSLLVKDGILNLEELEKTRVTKQQLYSMLREKKIHNLGKVKRAYLEACGILSVFETDENKAGLPLLPGKDKGINKIQTELDTSVKACCNCGHVQHILNENTSCDICTSKDWSIAYLSTS